MASRSFRVGRGRRGACCCILFSAMGMGWGAAAARSQDQVLTDAAAVQIKEDFLRARWDAARARTQILLNANQDDDALRTAERKVTLNLRVEPTAGLAPEAVEILVDGQSVLRARLGAQGANAPAWLSYPGVPVDVGSHVLTLVVNARREQLTAPFVSHAQPLRWESSRPFEVRSNHRELRVSARPPTSDTDGAAMSLEAVGR